LRRCWIISSFFVGALYALAAASPNQLVTSEIIDQAAELAGITILPEQKETMLSQLRDQRNSIAKVRQVHLANNVPPAFRFDPLLDWIAASGTTFGLSERSRRSALRRQS